MPVTFTSSNQAVAAKVSDLINSALLDAGILGAGETASTNDATMCQERMQRLIDQWNAREELIFSVSFSQFTLIPNHGPHTIGPAGDFNVSIRPVRVNSAAFILNSTGSNPVDTPIAIKDKNWWASNPVKSLTSSISTHLYYEPTATLGQLNFWPISNVANPVRLELWNSIGQAISLTTSLALPQGYWEALVSTLAVKMRSFYRLPADAVLIESQRQAMEVITDNNDEAPRIETDDGMPNSRHDGRPDFNFLTGLRE